MISSKENLGNEKTNDVLSDIFTRKLQFENYSYYIILKIKIPKNRYFYVKFHFIFI